MIHRLLPNIFYPIRVIVREKRGNSIILGFDRARRIKTKDGKEIYQLYKRKQNIEPPKFESYTIDTKGNTVLELFLPTSDDFRTISIKEKEMEKKFNLNPEQSQVISEILGLGFVKPKFLQVNMKVPELNVEDKVTRLWFVNEHKKTMDKYYRPHWLEKYAPYISLALLASLMAVQLIFWYKSTGAMSMHLSTAAQQFASAAESINSAAHSISGTPTPSLG